MEREREWLHARGLTDKTIQEAGLVFNDGKIKIPYRINGKEVGYQVRLIDRKEFYFNEGFNPRIYVPTGTYTTGYDIWVTEGVMDALILHQLGYPAVALPSSSTYNTVSELPFRNLFLAIDNDEPGDLACKKIAALGLPFKLFRVKYKGKDPNECILANGGTFPHEVVPYILGGYTQLKDIHLNGNVTNRCIMSFDGNLPSWNKGDLIVLYGGKSTGKTSWLLSIIAKYGKDVPTALEEYEMPGDRVVEWFANVGGDPNAKVFVPTEYLIDQSSFYARIYSVISNLDIKLLVIDTMHYHASGQDNVVQLITKMSQQLKILAMEKGIAVVLIAHETNGNIRDCHLIGSADHILHLRRLQNAIMLDGIHRYSPAGSYQFPLAFRSTQ